MIAVVAALGLSATGARADHDWNGYHWARTSNPFSLAIVDSVTGVWDSLLSQVSGDWTQSSVLNTSVTAGATGTLEQLLCQPVSRKIRSCSFSYGPTLWFGLASVWLSGGHITQATVQVNDFYFTGSYGNNVARRHVLCQEVGHTLGLDHHRQASCMDDTNSTLNNTSYQSPNAHDYAQLEAIYAHSDSTSTTGARVSGEPTVIVEREGSLTRVTSIFWVR